MDNTKKCFKIIQKIKAIDEKFKVCKLNPKRSLKEMIFLKENDYNSFIKYMYHFIKIYTSRINLPKDIGVIEYDALREYLLEGIKELLLLNKVDLFNNLGYLIVECKNIESARKKGELLHNLIINEANSERSLQFGFVYDWYDEIAKIIDFRKNQTNNTVFGKELEEYTLDFYIKLQKELYIIGKKSIDKIEKISFLTPEFEDNKPYKFDSSINKVKYIEQYDKSIKKAITKDLNITALLTYLIQSSLNYTSFDKGLIPVIEHIINNVQYSINGVLCNIDEIDTGIFIKYLCLYYGYLGKQNIIEAKRYFLNSFLKVKKRIIPYNLYRSFISNHILEFTDYFDRVEILKKISHSYIEYEPNNYYSGYNLSQLTYKEFKYILNYHVSIDKIIMYYNEYLKSESSFRVQMFILKYKQENENQVKEWERIYFEKSEKKRLEEEENQRIQEEEQKKIAEENLKKLAEIEKLNKQREQLTREEKQYSKKEIEQLKKECELDYSKAFTIGEYYFALAETNKEYFYDAMKYYMLSAEIGNIAAMNNVAICHLNLVNDDVKDYHHIQAATNYLKSKMDHSWRILYCYILLINRLTDKMLAIPEDVEYQYQKYINDPNVPQLAKDLLFCAYDTLHIYIHRTDSTRAVDKFNEIKEDMKSLFLVERFIEGYSLTMKKTRTLNYNQCIKFVDILNYYHNVGVIKASLELALISYYGFPTPIDYYVKREEAYDFFNNIANYEKWDLYHRQQYKHPDKTYQILSSLNGDYGRANKEYYDNLMLKAKEKCNKSS